ncbi:AAA family ATPase [Roseburia sp. 1XD42-69]|uniref:AAA family ATPase n=1 Tax=Roseburia sp. 1XD42-69 TaxID=2320088 RepID=UPI000EA14A94|nr:AAA family ATPase [Roseburia sp. 1XD42-69]
MKRSKWFFQIGIVSMLTLICVLFLGCTAYFLYTNNSGIASVFATLMGIPLTIGITLWSFIFSKLQKEVLIERYLNDEHFVDRDAEYVKLMNLIQSGQEKIIYISGNFGMGKTLFMKMSCDRINYADRKKWKSYAAFYYNNNHTKTIMQALSNKFCGQSNTSITDISKRLNNATFKKNSILFIDNIYEIDLIECIEFAKAFINCNKNNQVVIAVDSNNNTFHIYPGKFGETEIKLLAHSYNIKIEQAERCEISELSNGYPVYARYSVEAYTKGIKIVDYNNLENYIEELINSLNNLEKASLSLIICFSQLLQDGVETGVVCSIDNCITRPILKRLVTHSLINLYKDKVYSDKLISRKCMDFLSEYINESYYKIYQYYKGIYDTDYIALVAALKSNFEYDHTLVKEILHRQYIDNNFYLLIDIGELEFSGQINPHLRENKECWTYVRYYYLKSLLELGLYDKAREVVDNYDNYFNLMTINCDIDFEYQYLLIDLDHLTNYLKNAVTFSHALFEKATSKEQKIKCQYLYAHCLRHLGEDLDQAYTIFTSLANDTNFKDNKIRIRSIYSAASIKMFQGDSSYSYEESFGKVEQIIFEDSRNEVWRPYVARHKAIYEYKVCKNFEMAEQVLQETIHLLEVTQLRIKYDIYFELGELYRIWNNNTNNYTKSINYYLEAVQFAKRVNDYNLQSTSQLGIMLLSIKYGYKTDNDILKSIISRTYNIGLNINYNYAMYVKYLIENESIPKETVSYWRKMQYSDLFFYPRKVNLRNAISN